METNSKYAIKKTKSVRGFHRPYFMMEVEKKKVIKRK